MSAEQLRTNRRRTYPFGTAVSNTLLLARLYNHVIARERRLRIGIFSNIAFSLLASYVLVNLLQFYISGGFVLIGMLFIITAGIGLFNEFFNLINCNFVENIYAAGTTKVFPISCPVLFLKIFVNDLIGIRGVFYIGPSLVILWFAFAFNPEAILTGLGVVILFYLATSVIYAAVDYGYGLVKYKYGRNTEKAILLAVFALMAFVWIGAKYGWLTYPDIHDFVRHAAGVLVGKHD